MVRLRSCEGSRRSLLQGNLKDFSEAGCCGCVQVQVHPKKASGGAERRLASDAVLAKITTGSRHS